MEEPQSPPSKPVLPSSGRPGSKVSQIANRFQSTTMGPDKTDPGTTVTTTTTVGNNTRNNTETGAPVTESHATRFNNARALFEKLGEQDTKPIIPNKAEKLVVNTQLKSIPRSTNGHNGNIDINNETSTTTTTTTTKLHHQQQQETTKIHPVKPPKPDKPERKFSSKELIEKQRNWTAHFKNRTSQSPRSSFDKPQPPTMRAPIPPPITSLPAVINAPTSPIKIPILTTHLPEEKENIILTTSITEEKQEREEPEKRSSVVTPPSPVSPVHIVQPTAVSPTPSATESSADSTTQDVEKTLSDLSEPSPILVTNNLVSQETSPIITTNDDNMVLISPPTSPRKEINENIIPTSTSSETIDNKIEEEEEIESLISAHDKRKKISSVQLVLSSPESPIASSQFGNQIIEKDDDEKDIGLSPQEPRDAIVEVESLQKALDLKDVKFVDAEDEGEEEEEEEEEVETSESSSEISPEPSEETVSSVPSKDLSSPDNETPPTLPPKDMSPEIESLPPLPLSEAPKTLNISQPPRKPLPPSPIEEKLPELPENNFMPRSIPPQLPEKDFQKPLPPLPRREIPEFVESPPPLPPKDIPEDAIPVTVRMIGEPETMTKDEEEHLLSTRQEALLSDEEAQEVHRLLEDSNSEPITAELQPAAQPITTEQVPEGEGTAPASPSLAEDSITQPSDSTQLEATLDYRDRADISLTLEGSLSAGSQSETDSAGLLGSATSLTDHTVTLEQTEPTTNYVAIPCREVFVENGVHYLEDGHFWVEVPGLPESDEDDEELEEGVTIKQASRVSFSAGPMRMYSTHSVSDYDRRNEDVDPVAASAEYELEKRVEKMDVFPVELLKGPEGLGLSIIGMGVGADAGLEKLGIFVKTITDQGAAARDGRIQVNDQIIEVDGKSLVGVTQAYAASVLRNTSGLVKFLIGREKDPENSEVAQLIKQSLQADKERDEHRRHMQEGMSSPGDMSQGGDIPQSPDIAGTPPAPPPHRSGSAASAHNQYSSADLEAMRQVVKESQYKLAVADADIARLKQRLAEQERSGGEEVSEKIRAASQRLREMERGLQAAKKEVAAYQDMLEQSQGQYIALEKKYSKAKKLLKEFQEREKDLLHREEFHLQLLQEKDTEYNALVKTLKDRIIQLEQELLETQKAAGLAQQLPYDGSSIRQLTPQMGRKQQAPPVKPLLQQLDTELSDTEISDCSPEDTDKTSTVERKVPVKEELDRAVPQHELLDNSASKARVDLIKGGALAGRQLPTPSKKSPISSSGSEYGLDNSYNSGAEEEEESIKIVTETSSTMTKSHVTLERQERPGTLPVQHVQHQPIYQRTTYSSSHQDVGLTSMQAVYVSRGSYAPPAPVRSGIGPPPSLAEQLKQVLAERERRISSGEQREEEHKPSTISQTLVEEIRQAVQEANLRVKRVPAVLDSPPSSLSSSCSSVSPALRPSSAMDSRSNLTDPGSPEAVWLSQELLPQCTPGPHEKRPSTSHFWHSAPVSQWSKEQVCQWLLALGLEQHIPRFMEQNVTGPELLMLESKEMKSLGVGGDDKNRLKRKLKELRIQEERERKQMEKERKEKEKLQKKAEKLAEKASKIKK